MKEQGTLEADLHIAFAQIHYGKKDGQDFAQISFPDLGDMNNNVKSVVVGDNALDIVFDINGFDLMIHIEETDGELSGTADLHTIDMHHEFKPVYGSEQPEFDEHHFAIPKANAENIRQHNDYQRMECESIFEYELNNPDVLAYLQEKGIHAEHTHDLKTVRSLMKQTEHWIHQDGVNYCHDRVNRGTIAQIEHALKQDGKTNCRGMAIIMQGILRAYGFKANLVTCYPINKEDQDCHVVCEVFVEELNKTIMVDPSSNLLYYKKGVPLNLMELRDAIANDDIHELTINDDAVRDTESVDMMQMLAYMSKNLFFLEKSIVSCETKEATADNCICLCPDSLLNSCYPEVKIKTANILEFYIFE